MNPLAKTLIIIGAILIAAGLLIHLGDRVMPAGRFQLGKLPGDISVERENFRFYFPLASSILISLLLSAILYFIQRFRK